MKNRPVFFLIFSALVLFSVLASFSGAPTGVEAAGTIQTLIDGAVPGGTVVIPAGTYTESVVIDKDLTLEASAYGQVTIQAQANLRVITVTGTGRTLTLRRLILTGGNPTASGETSGGAVAINGILLVDNCRLYSNHGTYGGAIYQTGSGAVDVVNSSFIHDNTASVDGGGIYASGLFNMIDSTLNNNSASRHGGGVSADSMDTQGGTISVNQAGQNGGGANINNNVTIDGTVFSENIAGHDGGGLLQWNKDGVSVSIQKAFFHDNQAAANADQ